MRANQAVRSQIGAIRYALEKAGVAFIEENGGGQGVRMKRRIGKRTKASPKTKE